MQKIWRFYVHPLQRNLRECKIIKWITWPGPRLFQGQSAVRGLKFDIACKGTKFDDSSFFAFSRDINFKGCEILVCVTWPWPRSLRGQFVIRRLVILVAKPCTKFEVCILRRFEGILWGLNSLGQMTLTMPLSGTVSYPRANTWYSPQAHTKFRDSSFLNSRDNSGGVKC